MRQMIPAANAIMRLREDAAIGAILPGVEDGLVAPSTRRVPLAATVHPV